MSEHYENLEIKDKLYKDFIDNRHIIINRPIDDSLVENAILQIYKWNDIDTEISSDSKSYNRTTDGIIKIFINTNGGDASQMLSLISVMKTSKTPIYTYAMGKIYSAGFFIFINGHKRFAQYYSQFMVHQVSYGTIGFIEDHIDKLKYDTLQTQRFAEDMLLERTKIPKSKIKELREHKQDLFLYACSEEAKKWRIFDEYW